MQISASAERRIDAPASRVYGFIRDVQTHRPRLLPPAFGPLTVEEGGIGAGTVHRFTMTVGGRTTSYRVHVDEPEPGRVLTETDPEREMVTTFTVDSDGDGSRVRIETTWKGAAGVEGLVQRMAAPAVLGRIYDGILARLSDYACDALGPGRVLTVVVEG